MTQQSIITILSGFVLLVSASLSHAEPSQEQAKQTIKAFANDLKTTLVTTMKSQGPVAAINVCNVSAPAIAEQHSGDAYIISRTALKVRNPENQATAWQQDILKEFEQRLAEGTKMDSLDKVEQRDDGWYYIKAIGTGKPCLTCHGSELNPAVKAKLSELYPNDQATGFKLGDLRGAFVVKYQY